MFYDNKIADYGGTIRPHTCRREHAERPSECVLSCRRMYTVLETKVLCKYDGLAKCKRGIWCTFARGRDDIGQPILPLPLGKTCRKICEFFSPGSLHQEPLPFFTPLKPLKITSDHHTFAVYLRSDTSLGALIMK